MRRRRHVVSKPAELRALASPARQELLEALRLHGPCTVKELAAHLARPAESLYYHVHRLTSAGLVRPVAQRATARRDETVYDVVADLLKVDTRRRDAAWLRDVGRILGVRLRAAERDFAQALRDPGVVREGPGAEVASRHQRVRLRPEAVERLNAMLERVARFVEREDRRGEGRVYSLSFVLTPTSNARDPD